MTIVRRGEASLDEFAPPERAIEDNTTPPVWWTETAAAACRWLRNAITAGRTDSGLPTRFYYWLDTVVKEDVDYVQTMELFLRCCRMERITAYVNDRGGFTFVRMP